MVRVFYNGWRMKKTIKGWIVAEPTGVRGPPIKVWMFPNRRSAEKFADETDNFLISETGKIIVMNKKLKKVM